MNFEFKEKQKFTQWWIWFIHIGIAGLCAFGVYQQVIVGEKFGDKPMSDVGLIAITIVLFLLMAFIYFINLKTLINKEGIKMNFFPFVKKEIKWSEIKNAEVINYGFVGGWGIRFWTKYGTVYNIKGNKGLAIELDNGKKFIIGTQKEKELRYRIESYYKSLRIK